MVGKWKKLYSSHFKRKAGRPLQPSRLDYISRHVNEVIKNAVDMFDEYLKKTQNMKSNMGLTELQNKYLWKHMKNG